MTETESRPRNRALVASFLFTDLVGYSKGTASDQYAAKATLSEILGRNLAALRKDDYRIKDTGDGALIAFLSSPEHALYTALAIAHDFAHATSVAGFPSNNVRTGLHIGAVKEAIDLEARPNFVGDGINAAKRIMDFAEPGQITASRAYFEAVSWLDSEYAALFRHLGASDDKHGRPHELYAIAPSDAVLERLRRDLENAGTDAAAPGAKPAPAGRKTAAIAVTPGSVAAEGGPGTGARKWYAPIGALVALAVAVSIFLMVRTHAPDDVIAPAAQSKSSPAAPAAPPTVPATAAVTGRTTDGEPSALPSRVDVEPSSTAPPKADAAAPARSVPDASAPPTPARQAIPMARPGATNAAADTQRKAAELSAAPASARCRHILEKVQLGEPLSQDEKRELASSCR